MIISFSIIMLHRKSICNTTYDTKKGALHFHQLL
nr:MAG TPA: hypothetical protein [Caudoviricetes sp.]